MDFATSLSEVSQLGLEMHVFNVQPTAKSRLEDLIRRNQVTNQRLDFWYQIIPATYGSLSYVALIAALVGIWLLGGSDLSAIGAVTLLMFRAIRYGQVVQLKLTEVNANLPFLRQLDGELARYRASRQVDLGGEIGTVGALELRGVSFEYRDGLPVVRDIDATIESREVVGLIGPSGSGKSTLVQLLLGLREPTAGSVLSNGRDIHSLSRTEWARKVTFVPQEAHLVAGTVADNIRFFRDGITQQQIEHAARLANLHDDVMRWPEGYDREVGERGSHLSGGQQQRLVIARALVEEPDVFILDEPTSSLDVRSEQLIRTTLDSLRDRMTIIIIAHRLSTLDICDRIMVLIDGQLKAFDSPDSLEASNDFYREALVISGMR
jgi:ABC-type multidrug transport system fused ATPase/permease subunit